MTENKGRSLTFFGIRVIMRDDLPDGCMAMVSRGKEPVLSFDRKPTADDVRRARQACCNALWVANA